MQGIRSIGDEPHAIEFLKPLTLIQGPNGTGKTTIIEALNYVTSGTVPSGKHAAFVHDPKVANKARVDGLVQLKFEDVQENEVTATKRLTATVSKTATGIKIKSDESNLSITRKGDPGNPQQISSKVADFFAEVMTRLGVNKAVLDYVIFCHQEESAWPLSEPKILKTRFDEIFEVSEYVEVMENIKSEKKALEKKAELLDIELETHLAGYVHNSNGLLTDISNNTKKYDKNDKELQKLNTELAEIEKQLTKAQSKKKELDKLKSLYDVKKATVMGKEENLRSIDVEDYSGTLDQLRQELEAALASKEEEDSGEIDESNKLKAEIKKIEDSIKQEKIELENALKSKKMALVAAKNELSEYEKVIAAEQVLVKKTEDFKSHLDKSQKPLSLVFSKPIEKDFNRQLQVLLKDCEQKCSLEKKKLTEAEREVSKVTREITEIQTKISMKEESIERNKNDVAAVGIEPEEVKNKLETIRSQLKEHRDELSEKQGSQFLYKKWEDEVVKTKSCPLCEGSCQGGLDVEGLITKIKSLHIELPKEVRKLTKSVEKLEIEERSVIQVLPLVEQIENFGSQIENDTEALKLQEDVKEAKIKVREAAQKSSEEFQKKLDTIKGLLGEARLLDRFYDEKKAAENVVNNARENLSNFDAQEWSLDEMEDAKTKAQSLIESLKVELEALDNSIKKQSENSERKNELERKRVELECIKLNVTNKEKKSKILKDQLNKRILQSEIADLNGDLMEIEEKLEHLSELEKEIRILSQRQQTKNDRKQGLVGQQEPIEETINRAKKQLRQPNIQNAVETYRDKYAERCLTEEMAKDLGTYIKCLDDAIIAYHTLKMERINQILSELWAAVYDGTDIETIRIKSDPVSEKAADSKRKSYNYSVVMIVDQKELDMRDRCSAGQKVLASILIRIALAEVFAANCPILALDEPTTNLDTDKIDNIGHMLTRLIQAREDHLQLIVITHDIQLVNLLHTSCRPEYVYGLSKNEYGVSRLKRHTRIGDTQEP